RMAEELRCRDAHHAARGLGLCGHGALSLFDLREDAGAALEVGPTGGRRLQGPCGPFEQTHAEPFLQAGDALAYGRTWDAQRLSRAAKAPQAQHGDEGLDRIEVGHWSIIWTNMSHFYGLGQLHWTSQAMDIDAAPLETLRRAGGTYG